MSPHSASKLLPSSIHHGEGTTCPAPFLLHLPPGLAIATTLLQASSNLRWQWSPSSSSSSSFRLLSNSKRQTATTTYPASIAPGELPGYTGWARPERTSAGHFEIVGCSSCPSSSTSSWLSFGRSSGSGIDGIDYRQQKFLATAGKEFYVDVRCSHVDCIHNSRPTEFYLRAYGPSVITGVAKRLDKDGDGPTYRLSYYLHDAGSYTVEAVVAFTCPPPMESFPLGDDEEEPGYEGYLLHGFPLYLKVLPPHSSPPEPLFKGGSDDLPVCTIDQFPVHVHANETKDDDINNLMKGRWVVTEKVRDANYIGHTVDAHHVSLEGYQHAYNSLGIKMEYQPVGCRLVDGWSDADAKSKSVHLIFVGDSVMGLQHRHVRSAVTAAKGNDAKATIIGTHGGLAKRLDEVIEELQQIPAVNPNERRMVLFNAGLHDIAQLCSVKYKKARSEYFPLADDEFSCIEVYKTLLYKLTSFLVGYPAELVAFQTTSAGWMPYGNFGFAWNPNEYQPYSLSPNAVTHFNRAAMEIVENASGGRFPIVDGYYITLARPDHREIGEDNAIGKHMVHPGVEVVDAMARVWLTVVANVLAEHY